MTVINKRTHKYNVTSVEKVDTPEGMPGDDWHRYVLGEGTSKIEGLRPGTLGKVTEHAQKFCEELNDRIGRGGSTYSPRSKQK